MALLLAAIPVAVAGGFIPQVEGRPNHKLIALLFMAPAATLAAFVYGSSESTMFAFMALWGIRGGMTETTAALLITMAGLGNVLSQVPLGIIADRANRTLALAICGAFGFAGAALLPFALHSTWLVFAIVFVWGGLSAGLYTIGLTQLGARFSGANLAAANGLFVMLYSLGNVLGPPIAGVAMDNWSGYGLPMTLAAFFGLYSIMAFVRWKTKGEPVISPSQY